MRRRIVGNGLKINAIAGTHVVFFGLDLAKSKRPGFRGFGFKRFEAATGETIWLRGIKTFEETEPHPVKGEMFRSCDHPFQSFQWADYSVKPGQDYAYTVVAFYGTATDLKGKIEVEVPVTTEQETGKRKRRSNHSAGAVATARTSCTTSSSFSAKGKRR
jgi:hypothetical protein